MYRLVWGWWFAFALGVPASALAQTQMMMVPDTTRSIYVTGRGVSSTIPDTATVDLGIAAIDLDARRAKAVVDTAVAKIVTLAQNLGIPPDALTTAALNIEPRYAPDSPTKLLGYEVTRSVSAVLHDLAKLDAFLDGAVQAGANRDFDIEVKSSQEDRLRREALSRAIEDGRAQAVASAQQLGVRIGGVRSVSLNPSAAARGFYSVATSTGTTSAKFLPGTIKIEAQVSLTFALEDGTTNDR